jgi:RNA polymerase sigma factor (sigma-70 family)
MPADANDARTHWVRSALTRFEHPLTLYAARLIGDPEAARDIVQEAFLRLCRQRQSEVETHLAEWLYTVCRNLAFDRCRKDKRMRPLSTIEHQMTDQHEREPAADIPGSTQSVMQALSLLPKNQQEVVRLKFQHGLSYKEISRITELTVTNVGFLLHTALTTLRVRLARNAADANH